MRKIPASPSSLNDIVECYWSDALSFVEVKADSSEDLIDPTLRQSLRHVVSHRGIEDSSIGADANSG
jgi:hypothetical protein